MDQTHQSFTWAELAPGVWQRDIDEIETFWAQAARAYDNQGRQPFVIVGHLSLKIDTSAALLRSHISSALRKAWRRIRHDHPSIASQVEYDFHTERFTRTYQTARDELEKESWLNATFIEMEDGQSGVEYANSDLPAPDMPTMVILTPHSDDGVFEYRDIIFRAPHDTIDGIGTLLLLNNFLRHASDALEQGNDYVLPSLNGTEVQNLSPPYRVAAAVPQDLTSIQEERIKKMFSEHVFFANSQKEKQYLSLPFRQGAKVPSQHQRTAITLDRTTSSKLLEACKTVGATITHAFNATIPLVLQDLARESVPQQNLYYRCDLLRNLRPFCAEPYNTSEHPVTSYHSGSSFGFEIEMPTKKDGQSSRDDFKCILQDVTAFYRRVAEDSDHSYLAPFIWQGWLKVLPKLQKNPPPGPPPSPNAGVSLSSLGRVDSIIQPSIGRFSVSQPWVLGEQMSNGYGLFLSSYRGEISLGAAFNSAWHLEEDVRGFLKRCIEILLESLDVEFKEA